MKPPPVRVPRRSLLRALHAREQAPGSEHIPDGATLLRARRPAMGSHFEVALPANAPGALDVAERALDRIDALEAQMTIYRDDSELSRLNATAHTGPVRVESGLFALLEEALALSQETGGAYDVTSGALSRAWGFIQGPKRVPDAAALADARARSGHYLVRLDRERETVTFARPGVVLNLGSIGKGHAVDQAAAIVRDHWWPTPALVHGGLSSAFALGSPPDRFGGRWPIALKNPFDAGRPLGTIWLRNRAIGTSGAAFQAFEINGCRYGHIIDPRTGAPARTGPASVTVLAPTAALADALSTAFYLLGSAWAADYCARHPSVAALFVSESLSETGAPTIETVNIRPEDFDADPLVPVRRMNRC